MTIEAPTAPPAPPAAPASRSIPMELAREAGVLVGTFAVLHLLRWALQHHVPDANDAQFFWFFTPIFLVFDWWKLARARRAGKRDQGR